MTPPDVGPPPLRRDWPHRALAIVVTAHVVGAVLSTVQRVIVHAQINNFLIFRGSFWHLLHGQDLYAAYASEYADIYKYSPSFALLFAPFAIPPIAVGLCAWNVLNAWALCAAVSALLSSRAAAWTLGIVFFEALTAVQNAQSNGLVAALMILTLLATERRQPLLGATWIAIGASVKLFPIGAGVFGLLDRRRWTHLASCAAIGVALLALPLLITSPASLAAQYRSWLVVENADRTQPGMMWIGGALEWARGAPVPHAPIQLVGLTWMLFATYRCMSQWSDATVRRLFLASTLVFATIFNHQAESPSYVIAFTGIGIWWSVLRRARWRDAVMVGAFVFGSVSGTDIAPGTWRQIYLFTWQLKAIVATVVWCAIQYDLWRAITPSRRSPNESAMRPAVPESAHS